jgi:hypothetical protein
MEWGLIWFGGAFAALFWSLVGSPPPAPSIHHKEGFGIEAPFPPGSRVCQVQSGGHAHGFYMWLDPTSECDPPTDRRPARKISISGVYNSSFRESPVHYLRCTPGTVPSGVRANLRDLTFRGLASTACGLQVEDGSIQFFIVAQGGRWRSPQESPEFATARTHYYAVLTTTPSYVDEDLETFQAFLGGLGIRPEATDE